MKNSKHNPATSIKCKFSNAVHKILEPNLGIKRNERWKHQDKYKFTNEQKLEMFDQIFKMHSETSNELVSYKFKKSYKKRVQNDRVARGYVAKKKTRKADYLVTVK